MNIEIGGVVAGVEKIPYPMSLLEILLMDISTGANKTINKHNIGLGNCPKIGFRAALAALDIARFIHFHYLMGHIMV